MSTRKEVANRIRDREFSNPYDLLDLDDYEFEQWCADTAKGLRSEYEMAWVEVEPELAERWVDGLESLIDSADTQIEYAENELDNLWHEGKESEAEELEARQGDWIPKVRTFQRKVRKTLRKAQRNLNRMRRTERDMAKTLIEAIEEHRNATLQEFGEGTEEDDSLWSVLE